MLFRAVRVGVCFAEEARDGFGEFDWELVFYRVKLYCVLWARWKRAGDYLLIDGDVCCRGKFLNEIVWEYIPSECLVLLEKQSLSISK